MANVTAARPWTAGPRLRFVGRRLRRLVVSLAIVVTASFLLIHLVPGDPVRAALGVSAPAELVEARREELGLNDPLPLQFLHYVQGLLTGDLGTALTGQQPVAAIIGQRLPDTLLLAGTAFLVVMATALPLGVGMGVWTHGGRKRRAELVFTSVTGVLVAVPEFLLAVGLIFLFGVSLGVLPVAGSGGVLHLVLPVAALAVGPVAYLSRMVRVEALTVLGQDYMRTARAKRLPGRIRYIRHGVPNMLTSALTAGGLILTGMVAGTVLVETIFAWPGLGSTMVKAIVDKDYPTVQGIVLVYAVMVLAVNLAVDLLLSVLDPRSTITET